MKVKQFFSKWSREIHRWVGLYFALVTLIYITEMVALPSVFSNGLPVVDGKPPVVEVQESNDTKLLSQEVAKEQFIQQQPPGLNSEDEIDEITYFTANKIYRFANSEKLFEWYVDASSGEIIKYGFNVTDFLEFKGLLGWLYPWIHNTIEVSFLFFMATLGVTGVYLFIYPFLNKLRSEKVNSAENSSVQEVVNR
ncbi:MAG: hypothetical protein AAF349_14285 [Cyanobacteria bacterium P01_A01_bin.68]